MINNSVAEKTGQKNAGPHFLAFSGVFFAARRFQNRIRKKENQLKVDWCQLKSLLKLTILNIVEGGRLKWWFIEYLQIVGGPTLIKSQHYKGLGELLNCEWLVKACNPVIFRMVNMEWSTQVLTVGYSMFLFQK